MSLPRRVSFPPDALHEEPSLTDSPLSSPALPDYGPHSSPTPITSNGSPEGTTNSDSTGPRRRQQPSRQVTLDANLPTATRRQTTESARTQRSRAGSRRTSDSLDPNTGLVRRVTTVLFTPPKKVGKAPTYWGSLKAAITSTWL